MTEAAKSILVPVDGSPAALRAAEHAIVLLHAGLAQRAILLNVQPPVMAGDISSLVPVDTVQRARILQGELLMAPARKLFADAGLEHVLRIELGDPGETIAAAAASNDCTHIVLGTRGLGRIASLVLGSVANKVVHLSQVPVTLVR